MIASQRSMYIMDQLTQKSVIDLKEIARALNTSESTVRRDIERLEMQGKLKRVPGGAELVNIPETRVTEVITMSLRQRRNEHAAEKQQVAERAAQMVKDNSCVFIDGGTSTLPLIRLLSMRRIQIVTNNYLALREQVNPEAVIIPVGGIYLAHFHMTAGALAESFVENFHFDNAFISIPGVDLAEGMSYVCETDTIGLKRAAMQRADEKCLLIDSSKLRFKAFCRFSPLSDFDSVICNDDGSVSVYPDNFIIA